MTDFLNHVIIIIYKRTFTNFTSKLYHYHSDF